MNQPLGTPEAFAAEYRRSAGIEWILARVSPRPLRLAWCLLAAALAGEIVYLVLDIHVPLFEGFLAVVLGLAAAGLVAIVFYRSAETSRDQRT